MAEEIGSKPIDVQTLENIDSFDDLPDVTELTEEQLYAIRSGDLSSDYIAPFEWDGESYEKWRSIIDGRNIEIPDSVVEDWERDNPLDDYDGPTGDYSIASNGAPEGDSYLEMSTTNDNNPIYRTDGVEAVPTKGDVFSSVINTVTDYPAWGYAWSVDNGNHSGYSVWEINGDVRIRRYDDESHSNNGTDILEFSASFNTDWIEMEIEWHDGSGGESDNTHVLNVYEYDLTNQERGDFVASDSVVDSNHQSGGISIANESDETGPLHDRYWIVGQVD